MIEILLTLLVMVVLLLLEGFFSGSEIAMVNADRYRMRYLANQGHKGARLLVKMFQRPEIILGTTLVGTNISLVALTTLGTLLMIRWFGAYGDLIALIIYTPLFLIFGEVVPKSVYQQKADLLAPRIIYPIRFFSVIFYPVVFVFSRLARLFVRLIGVKASRQSPFITREQVRMILESAEQAASIDVFDRDRLIRAIRFADTTVGEVMIPIAEVIMLHHRQAMIDAIRVAREHGNFRLPVYDDEPGNIIGVVSLSIWELMDPGLAQQSLEELRKPVMYVVENQPVDEILGELQHRDDQMAIVVDEFGSATGIITLEDVLERVLGEVVNLDFNFEAHVPHGKGHINKLGDEHYRIDGRALIYDVAESLGITLTHEYVHTLGGLLISEFRHLPRVGESMVISGYRFSVEEVSDKSITSILVEPE